MAEFCTAISAQLFSAQKRTSGAGVRARQPISGLLRNGETAWRLRPGTAAANVIFIKADPNLALQTHGIELMFTDVDPDIAGVLLHLNHC